MDWRKWSFDWNRARSFLVTAEEGSFSAAARALGMAQPTLGRQVAALEEELGVTLFERVGTRLALTATGLDLVEHVRAMNEAAMRFSRIAAGQAHALDGLVRIAASEAISAHLLPPIVDALRAAHPGIHVELVASNTTSDLRRREADLAIRNVRPRGDDLIARLVQEKNVAHLYAAPSYLARIGNPRTAETLAARGHVIGFDDRDTLRDLLRGHGLPFRDDSFPLRTENHLVQWELAKRGLGMCVMMEAIGDPEPAVRRALPSHPGVFEFPTWLICHRELATSRRLRTVFDFLAAALAPRAARRRGGAAVRARA